jgi:hypothetical protein
MKAVEKSEKRVRVVSASGKLTLHNEHQKTRRDMCTHPPAAASSAKW